MCCVYACESALLLFVTPISFSVMATDEMPWFLGTMERDKADKFLMEVSNRKNVHIVTLDTVDHSGLYCSYIL